MLDLKDNRRDLARLRLLVDILHKVTLTLDPAKSDLANLLRVEVLPRLIVHVLKKRHDVDWIHEIDESVADVAIVVQIKRKVEEVVRSLVQPVDALQEHLLGVLVRNMTNHNRGAPVLAAEQSLKIYRELWVASALLHVVLLVGIGGVVSSHRAAEWVLHTWGHLHLLSWRENWSAVAEWVNLTVEVFLLGCLGELEAWGLGDRNVRVARWGSRLLKALILRRVPGAAERLGKLGSEHESDVRAKLVRRHHLVSLLQAWLHLVRQDAVREALIRLLRRHNELRGGAILVKRGRVEVLKEL